ncbi:MAG: type I-MYXAN CRISPR-associated protein Cas6/Cmx6 [Planctomycetaceae bacterium]
MTHLDLAFTLTTQQPILVDHGYALYGAVSRILPELHRENGFGIHPIRGRQIGDRQMILMPWSTLTVRVPDGEIAPLLPLAGKSLRLGDATLRVGVPEVQALVPVPVLISRLVVVKVAHVTPAHTLSEEQFLVAIRKQLDTLGISSAATPQIPLNKDGLPRRRTLRIKHREIVGYELVVDGLSAEESITLQTHGLGGRRHMGCGVFVAYPPKGGSHAS